MPFILCSASLNGTAVSTLNSSSWNAGMERLMLGAAGNYRAEFAALMRQAQRGSLSTRKITAISEPVLGNGSLTFRDVAEGSVGGSSYISLTGTNGATLIVPRQIIWSAGQAAALSVDMFFLSSDGVAAPLTVGTTAGNLTAEADVWVGNGGGINSITVDFGYEINFPPDGFLYPKHSFIISQRPMISIVTSERASLITTANLNPGSISTLTAILAKIADGGVRGTQKQYALNGHLSLGSIDGDKPGTVRKMLNGTGTFTIS